METNWNQLIELYLQNELSEEGRAAFEQELQLNPELREELEMHQLIQSAAKRASQRMVIKQTGQAYLRNLRIKQFTIGVVVTAATTVGIIYWVQNKKHAETTEPKQESVAQNKQEVQERSIPSGDTLINQPAQTGDKSSLIQSSDWKAVDEGSTRTTVSLASPKAKNKVNQPIFAVNKNGKEVLTAVDLKNDRNRLQLDTVSLSGKVPTKVLGYTNDRLNGKVVESKVKENTGSSSKNASLNGVAWELQYDSIGHFNDLYCGYALVMDESKFGFVDRKGNIFIPLIYDKIVVTSSIQSSRNKTRRKDQKVLYIPKRSGSEVQYCDEDVHPMLK
ncbi:WG repeat-containing protein [Fluviicola sp.]|uniref:WG repeat-containing protein n=1 Tax=Fluviicola sp. TaxID=1917219 RepID=UPI003D2993FB